MGMLIAKKYPTILALGAADHTYVECGGGGKAWACWGGKAGGTAFNSGAGSTLRADRIAEPNERAGVTCYLVNGVCHQAANRILIPAGIQVNGARGYVLSLSIYGAYGKTGGRLCYAPLRTHAGVTGDLPECLSAATATPPPRLALAAGEDAHIRATKLAYNRFNARTASAQDAMNFHVSLFEREMAHRFKGTMPRQAAAGLRQAKTRLELDHHQLTMVWALRNLPAVEFVKSINELTLRFQDDAANTLTPTQYRQMMDLGRDERLVLAEPAGVDAYFGEGTARAVYGNR